MALCEEAVAIAREVGDRRSIAIGLANLGQVAKILDDYTKAGALLEEAVSISREFGRRSAAEPLATLGEARFLQGDLVAARATSANLSKHTATSETGVESRESSIRSR